MKDQLEIKQIIPLVKIWSTRRNIGMAKDAIPQAAKTISEASELLDACVQNDRDEIIDGIGDVLVTIIIQCKIQGVTLEDCLNKAWSEIKDRKGKTVNGTFIKDGD